MLLQINHVMLGYHGTQSLALDLFSVFYTKIIYSQQNSIIMGLPLCFTLLYEVQRYQHK